MSSLKEFRISSDKLETVYPVWATSKSFSESQQVCLFLDAEIYLHRMQLEDWITEWNESSPEKPLTGVFLSHIDQSHRHRDFVCNEDYTEFLVEVAIPYLREWDIISDKPPILVGLSLSGLAAIYAAWKHPDAFSGVLSQSPSAWWEDEWFITEFQAAPQLLTPVWLSVGLREIDEYVEHTPTLIQQISQLESCRRLADVLLNSGCNVKLHEFDGGHDPDCWRAELSDAFRSIL